MGWSGGSELAGSIWNLISDDITKARRKYVAKRLIDLFEDMDCDTMDECEELQAAAKGK